MNTTGLLKSVFPQGGFFVEAGAHDGIGDSQTYALEQTGLWKGICVEPSSAFQGLCRSRKCKVDNRCLWIEDTASVIFQEMQGNAIELSGIPLMFSDKRDRLTPPHLIKHIRACTLTTLLQDHAAPRRIEFLCLDTEGSELAILAHHDFDRYWFAVMAIEHNGVPERINGLQALLEPLGYELVENDGTNSFFIEGGLR